MLVFINFCRKLKLSKAPLTSASPWIGPIEEAGAGAIKPGPEWQDSGVGVKEESQVAGRFLGLLSVGESRNSVLSQSKGWAELPHAWASIGQTLHSRTKKLGIDRGQYP
jgi:hypothetical protein